MSQTWRLLSYYENSVFKKNPFLNFSPQLTAFFQQNNVSKIQRVPYPNVNVMQTPGLIPNPAIWSWSEHPQPCWWSRLAPTSMSMLSLHRVFWVVAEGRWGKVMAKPLANRVIVGKKHARVCTHSHTHTYTHIPKYINLLTSAARYSSVNTFCQGYSERHFHPSFVCVFVCWKLRCWYRKEGFKGKLW